MTADPRSLTATFTVQMAPDAPVPGAADRFTLTKTWSGEVEGTSRGTMLTAGDPESGSAGYVAIELFAAPARSPSSSSAPWPTAVPPCGT